MGAGILFGKPATDDHAFLNGGKGFVVALQFTESVGELSQRRSKVGQVSVGALSCESSEYGDGFFDRGEGFFVTAQPSSRRARLCSEIAKSGR